MMDVTDLWQRGWQQHHCVNKSVVNLDQHFINLFIAHLFQCLADGGDLNSFEFKSLTDSLNDIKASIDPSNLR